MITCAKCGQQLDDDAIFCDKCGNKVAQQSQPVQQPHPVQPQYAQQAQPTPPQQFVQQVNTQPTMPPVKKSNKKIIIICVAAAVAVVAIVLVLVLFILPAISGNNNSSVTSSTSERSEDNKVSSEANSKEPAESEDSSDFDIEEPKESENSSEVNSGEFGESDVPPSLNNTISDFFYTKNDSLYICENGNNIREICSGTPAEYTISEDGSVLLYIKDTDLYLKKVNDGAEPSVISVSSVSRFILSEDASAVIYFTPNDEIYRYNINSGKSEMLVSDLKYNCKISPDLRNIVYIDNDYNLKMVQGNADNKITIDSGFDILEDYVTHYFLFYIFVDNDFESLCYVLDGDLYYKRIGEERQLIAEGVDGIYGGSINIDADDFYYWDAQNVLHYFKDGKTTEVTDKAKSFAYHFGSFNGYIGRCNVDEDSAVFVNGEKSVIFKADPYDINYANVSADGRTLYYSCKDESTGNISLYKVDISGETATPEIIDDSIAGSFALTEDRKVLYGKRNENSSYDLYIDGEKIDSNLNEYGYIIYQDGKYYYSIDCNSVNESGTLKCYTSGGSVETIDEDVNSFDILPSGEVLYIKDDYFSIVDGNMIYYNGDLYIYDGKESKKIDGDVFLSPENASISLYFTPAR